MPSVSLMGQGNAARRKDFLLEGGHCAIIGIFFSAANIQLRNRFQCLSHWGYTVLYDPLDAIRFMETLNAFTGNLLDTDGTYQVGAAELSIVRLGKNHLLWIEFAGHDGQIQLDKRSCRIVASILGRVIASCDFL